MQFLDVCGGGASIVASFSDFFSFFLIHICFIIFLFSECIFKLTKKMFFSFSIFFDIKAFKCKVSK